MKSFERDGKVDIIKGIGILLMVMGHAGFKYSNFIYLFHMALFFIVAGYCYNVTYSETLDSVWKLFVKRMKSLWLPYAFFNVIFVLLNNVFIRLNIYTNDKRFLSTPQGEFTKLQNLLGVDEMFNTAMRSLAFSYSPQIAGAAWFLKTLFLVTMLYCCIDFLIQKTSKINKFVPFCLHILVSVTLLIAGYQCKIQGKPLQDSMHLVFAIYFMLSFGFYFKQMHIDKLFRFPVILIIISFIILYQCNKKGFISLVICEYTNPVFLVIASISGWIFVYGIACYIIKFNILTKIFAYLGEHTLIILFMHFLAFKIISFIQILIYDVPYYMIASFPTYNNKGIWFYLYSLVGIVVPLFIEFLGKHIWNGVHENKNKRKKIVL